MPRWQAPVPVHVEAGWASDDCIGETRWLETLDKSHGVAARYVVRGGPF